MERGLINHGVDIHLYICKDKKYIAEDIFEGRNSSWFANMQKEGIDDTYQYLPIQYGISEKDTPDDYNHYNHDLGYYGFYYIKVEDFKNWFLQYRPDEDAGWVTRYEKWAYNNKGIYPEYLKKELTKNDVIEDMRFIVVTNQYDCSAWLYTYLLDNDIPDDAVIQYCFDH